MPRALSAEADVCLAMEFVIYERHQFIDRLPIAVAPRAQERCNPVSVVHSLLRENKFETARLYSEKMTTLEFFRYRLNLFETVCERITL